MCLDRHVQSNHKEEVKVEVYFLHEDKHRSFLQTDTVIFVGFGQASSNLPK